MRFNLRGIAKTHKRLDSGTRQPITTHGAAALACRPLPSP